MPGQCLTGERFNKFPSVLLKLLKSIKNAKKKKLSTKAHSSELSILTSRILNYATLNISNEHCLSVFYHLL